MYSSFQLAKKYLQYYITASSGKGHGIHSPFIFDFISNVLNDKKNYDCYHSIELQRQKLLKDEAVIQVEDFGAGSGIIKTNSRVLKDIAASSLKPKKYAQMLYRMVKHYQPATILELGTSFGITTAYLAKGNPVAQVYTCEGAKEIAEIASATFNKLELEGIKPQTGPFEKTLPSLLQQLKTIDFAFVDGNHRRQPTVEYFQRLLQHSSPNSLFVFDDIHWSSEMEEAWLEIKNHPTVTCSIDLFFIGIIIFNKDFKSPQHFTLRF